MSKISLRKAIDAHCRGCIYDKAVPGTWRKQVEACTVTTCELYDVRPKGKPRTASRGGEVPPQLREYHEKQKAIKQAQNSVTEGLDNE